MKFFITNQMKNWRKLLLSLFHFLMILILPNLRLFTILSRTISNFVLNGNFNEVILKFLFQQFIMEKGKSGIPSRYSKWARERGRNKNYSGFVFDI